jgi:hypothetical protein
MAASRSSTPCRHGQRSRPPRRCRRACHTRDRSPSPSSPRLVVTLVQSSWIAGKTAAFAEAAMPPVKVPQHIRRWYWGRSPPARCHRCGEVDAQLLSGMRRAGVRRGPSSTSSWTDRRKHDVASSYAAAVPELRFRSASVPAIGLEAVLSVASDRCTIPSISEATSPWSRR